MAHIVANHANNTRKEDNRKYGKADEEGRLFFPYEGRVASSDDSKSIRLSKENLLEVNFPWMSTTNEPLTKIKGNVLPITESDVISAFLADFMKEIRPVISNICAE